MKNPYSKIIKRLMKSDKIKVSRKDNSYYVSDGVAAIKISENLYLDFFTTENPIFKEIENETTITIIDSIIAKDKCFIDFSKHFNWLESCSFDAELTPFILDVPINKKERLVTIIKGKNNFGIYNREYLKAFEEIHSFNKLYSEKENITYSMIGINANENCSWVLMPIRYTCSLKSIIDNYFGG